MVLTFEGLFHGLGDVVPFTPDQLMELFLVLIPPFDLVVFLNIEIRRHKIHDRFNFNTVQLLLTGDELQFWKKSICGKVRGNFEIGFWCCFVASFFHVFFERNPSCHPR